MNVAESIPLLEGEGFIFIRHGQSEANAAGLIAGSLDSPLTLLGRSQATAAAVSLDAFSPDRIFCSGSLRAMETAILIGKRFDCSPVVELGLGERSWGDLEGKPLGVRPHSAREAVPPRGETWRKFSSRTMAVFRKLVGTQRTLVVAHSGTYRVLREYLLNGNPDSETVSNCQIVLFKRSQGVWSASLAR
jgi:2,3-bisphosphoglycerate-dependent phosphoglycerate mutase